jgi:hypothetical protein
LLGLGACVSCSGGAGGGNVGSSGGAGAGGTGDTGLDSGLAGSSSSGAGGSSGGSGGSAAPDDASSASDSAGGNDGSAAVPDAAGSSSADASQFPQAGCAPGAIFCDGFEDYPIEPKPFDAMNNLYDLIKTGDTLPTWLSYHFHGPPRVDASKPFSGKQDYHVNTESGHGAAADIIKESPDGVDLWPAAHYGRVMVWLAAIPPKSAWGIMSESGLLPGSTTVTAEYTLGGVNGQLSFTYNQRKRIVKNDVSSPKLRRGGNAEFNDPAPLVQCTVAATAQTLKAGQWACVEWMIDRSKSELHLWVDGTAQTQVDVSGGGGTCAIGTAATWQGPDHFTELDLGWEVYGNDVGGWEGWFDEFAVGTQRLNCPTMGK